MAVWTVNRRQWPIIYYEISSEWMDDFYFVLRFKKTPSVRVLLLLLLWRRVSCAAEYRYLPTSDVQNPIFKSTVFFLLKKWPLYRFIICFFFLNIKLTEFYLFNLYVYRFVAVRYQKWFPRRTNQVRHAFRKVATLENRNEMPGRKFVCRQTKKHAHTVNPVHYSLGSEP